jgi:hypothetical protein
MATAKVTLSVVEKNGQGKRECGAAILSECYGLLMEGHYTQNGGSP